MKPLHPFSLVEFEGIGPGPLCGRILADLGARVTVVARPGHSAVVRCAKASRSSNWT
jgi:alpha-methylacyl-CoA racemase